MDAKFFEVRDRATRIVVLAIRADRKSEVLVERQAWYAAGYEAPTILLTQLYNATSASDPYTWPEGTMRWAHEHIENHWDELLSGAVIDVRVFKRKESTSPAPSEIFI